MKGLTFIQLNKSVIKYIPIVVKITSHLNNYAKTHYAERTIIIIKVGLLPIWRWQTIGIMILLSSHSPSVKSVAGNGDSSEELGEVKFLWS